MDGERRRCESWPSTGGTTGFTTDFGSGGELRPREGTPPPSFLPSPPFLPPTLVELFIDPSLFPHQAFVVVFQAHGVMGADIVTPNIGPPEMARRLMKEEADVATQTIDVNGHEVLVDNE